MYPGHIRPDLVQAGHRLAEEFDEAGLCPAVAAWIHEHKVGEWRYYVRSPMADLIQRNRVRRALRHMMETIDPPDDFQAHNVYVMNLNCHHLIAIGSKFKFLGGSPLYLEAVIIGRSTLDAIVYRFNTRQIAPKSRDIRRFISFERNLGGLREALISSAASAR